jgi:cell division protein FtsB
MVTRRRSTVLLVCLSLATYLGYHAIKGKHGLEARVRLTSTAHRLDGELAHLLAVRSRLERDVSLLAEADPDPDLVEELARGLLGYARPSDLLLLDASAVVRGR